MNKIILKNKYKSKILFLFTKHIKNNQKGYIIACMVFFLGFIAGIIYFNNSDSDTISNLSMHIKNIANDLKETDSIDYIENLKESVIINFILVFIIWFSSSTIIGIPIIYGEIAFKGFALSYTISSIFITFGVKNGIIYIFSSLFIHNLISIPVLIATTVSGLKMYQSIIKKIEKENMKTDFFRHTIFCIFMLVLLLIASLVETYISINLLKTTLKIIKI